jgi:hypothetical protein
MSILPLPLVLVLAVASVAAAFRRAKYSEGRGFARCESCAIVRGSFSSNIKIGAKRLPLAPTHPRKISNLPCSRPILIFRRAGISLRTGIALRQLRGDVLHVVLGFGERRDAAVTINDLRPRVIGCEGEAEVALIAID